MPWPTKKLGEVLELCDSGTWGEESPDGLPLLRSTNMQKGSLVLDDLKTIAVPKDKIDRYLLREGDILITKSSGSVDHIGKSLYITKDIDGKYGFSNFTQRLRVNRKLVLPRWVYLKISNPETRDFLLGASQTTTGLRNLKISALKELEIPLPSLSEQKKIVAKLESVLGKIGEAKKLRAEAQEAAKNLLPSELHKIFSRKKTGWQEKELGKVFVLNYGKGLPRPERSEDGKYIVYGANGELGRSDKFLIEGDGIIIGRKGSAGELTRVSGKYWPTDVTYFVTEDKNYHIGFAYYLFKFLNFPQYAVGVKPGINRNQIYEIKIPLPPLAEQKKIVKHLDSLSEKVQKLRQYQKSTQSDLLTLEQSILHKAFV